jgi:anti-sigma B factor antagonist
LFELQQARIDAHFSVEFRKCVEQLINSGQKKIILNMKHVEFIDSSGLGAVVAIKRIMKMIGSNKNLVLCHLTDAVQHVFELTQVSKLFVLCSLEDDAITLLNEEV